MFDNHKDLLVSPLHKVLLNGYECEMYFGTHEVLAAAKDLVDEKHILRKVGGVVEYFHILFDQHQIIFSNGAKTESFHPGSVGMNAVDIQSREEIYTLFPELRDNFALYGVNARQCLKRYEAQLWTRFVFGTEKRASTKK